MRLFLLGVRRLHAEVRQDVRHHFADGGRGHLAAADVDAGAAARRIEQHEDDDLRIVRRSEADERDDVFLRAAGRVLRNLFRRAGLAADAVARDIGVLAGAVDGVADDLLKDLAHGGARLLAHDLTHHGRRIGHDRLPVAVDDALDHIRLHEIAAVDAGADRRDELQRRDRKRLAERSRRELREVFGVIERVLAPPDAAALAGQVDAGLGGEAAVDVVGQVQEAERLGILVKCARADELADLHERDVARVLHGLRERLAAVAGRLPALDRIGTAEHGDAAAAVKRRAFIDHALLERHGQRDDLERRAGLVGIRECLVAPLLLLRGGQQLRALVGVGLGVDGLLILVADLLVVVEVKIPERDHAEDRAGARVHGDGCRTVLHVVVLDRLLQVLFEVILDGGVDGQVHVVALCLVVVILVVDKEHIRAAVIRRADDAPGAAGEVAVIALLEAVATLVVLPDEADDMRGQASVGIIALRVRLDLDADEVILLFERAHLFRHVRLDLALDDFIPAVGIFRHVQDLIIIDVEDLRKFSRDHLRVFLVRGDLGRTDKDRVDRGVHGQDLAVRVIDRAARGRDLRLAHLLVERHFLILVMVYDHDAEQLDAKDSKCKDAAHNQKQACAAEHHDIRCFGTCSKGHTVIPAPGSFIRHVCLLVSAGMVLSYRLAHRKYSTMEVRKSPKRSARLSGSAAV